MSTIQIKICQVDNEENAFDFKFDLLKTTIPEFKNAIFAFFKKMFDEFNCPLNNSEFYMDNINYAPFFDNSKTFANHFKNQSSFNFYFLVIDDGIHFYKEVKSEEECPNNGVNANNQIELRKDVDEGKLFKVAIQTYNHLIKEIEVFPEMTVGQFKQKIEESFLVRKEYQELIYLIYKLVDDNKCLKDYFIRPNGIIFLRGFYFPLIFVDFFERKNQKIVSINIAEQIKFIRNEIIERLGLDANLNYKLIFNGKELNENDFLIDYNVQKMQIIYLK